MTLAVLLKTETMPQDLRLHCIACDATLAPTLVYRCPDCGGILEVVRQKPEGRGWVRADFVGDDITLGEGGTPLRELRPSLLHAGFKGRLLVKDETRNPSGSFKDRLVAASLSRAIALGATGIVSASSGNAGAAAACYAANAGIPAIIVCPDATPRGKLAQIVAYGATLEQVPGHYGNSFEHAKRICAETGYANLTTTYLNPYGVDALRLIGQELYEQMECVGPDWIAIPTSSGPLVKGVFQGFMDRAGKVPRLIAAQSEGCAPIARAFEDGKSTLMAGRTPKRSLRAFRTRCWAIPRKAA